MTNPSAPAEQDFSEALIQYDSHPRGPDEMGIHLFSMSAGATEEYFEAAYQFEENGNDFCVFISNFGLYRKTLAGSQTPLAQKAFTSTAIGTIRNRIREYFGGAEKKNFFHLLRIVDEF